MIFVTIYNTVVRLANLLIATEEAKKYFSIVVSIVFIDLRCMQLLNICSHSGG